MGEKKKNEMIMDEENKNEEGEFLSTIAIGAIIAAAVGGYLLFGTQKGRSAIGGALTALGIKTIRDNWNPVDDGNIINKK